MCKAFEDHYKSGVRAGIMAMICDNRDEGKTIENIADKLQRYFSLDREEAMKYINGCH